LDKYITYNNQSIIDIAIQTTGGLEGLFNLISSNPDKLVSVNDIVNGRTTLEVPTEKSNEDVFNFLNGGGTNQIDINTGDQDEVLKGDFNNDWSGDFNIF